MKIGLFLDVDRTLTCEIIQREFARLLGCLAEFNPIEEDFRQGRNSKLFADRAIKLFASKHFTDNKAGSHFESIELQPHADELLKLDGNGSVDVFLVSNGPSYYINRLADRYSINKKTRVLCSEYSFSPASKLIEKCSPVTVLQKADFVKPFLKDYDITIGVGDDPNIDGPFISVCNIQILTEQHNGFMYVDSLQTIIRLINQFIQSGLERPLKTQTGSIKITDVLRAVFLMRLHYQTYLFVLVICLLVFWLGTLYPSFRPEVWDILKSVGTSLFG